MGEQGEQGEPAVLPAPDAAGIRDELQRLVLADLLGPLDGAEEEFGEDPTDRYILGRLAPDGTVLDPAEQDLLGRLGRG